MLNMSDERNAPGLKAAITVVLILAIAAVAIVSIVRDRIVNYPQYQVSVTGQGKVAYQPDGATITFGVQIDKSSKADEALNQLNSRISNVVAALKGKGISADDIVTQSYSLYPQYDYANNISVLSGYNANQQIIVKIRDIKNSPDKVSQAVVEASKAGANQILGISFDVSNLEDLKQEARLKAIADAEGKVGKIASAAGVRLKGVVGWWENYLQGPGAPGSNYADGKGGLGSSGSGINNVSASIPTGSQEIVVEMNLSYRLK